MPITHTVRNQVFIGCPYKTVRPKYERVIRELNKKYPLCFEIIGSTTSREATELLGLIKEKLGASSAAIFDATGGNANVSLEFGYAEGRNIPRHIYISEHGSATKVHKSSSIIADLQGKVRNVYKQEAALDSMLENFCKSHPYSVKFDRVLRRAVHREGTGQKIRLRKLAVKIVHQLDHQPDGVRHSDVVQNMTADGYSDDETTRVIGYLHKGGLLVSNRGGHSYIEI